MLDLFARRVLIQCCQSMALDESPKYMHLFFIWVVKRFHQLAITDYLCACEWLASPPGCLLGWGRGSDRLPPGFMTLWRRQKLNVFNQLKWKYPFAPWAALIFLKKTKYLTLFSSSHTLWTQRTKHQFLKCFLGLFSKIAYFGASCEL